MKPSLWILIVTFCMAASCSDPSSSRPSATTAPSAGTINPGRGYFQWTGMQVVPPHAAESTAPTVYKRFTWRDVEPALGVYQWGALNALFDENPHSRVAFRIRSMTDYGTADPSDAVPKLVPDGIPGWEADTSGDGTADVFVPDWNAEAYLAGVERLWAALQLELAKNGPDGQPRSSRIAWIDLGLYGQYGEWYLRTAPSTNSPSAPWVDYSKAPSGVIPFAAFENTKSNPRKRLLDAQLKAFPDAHWVMFFLYEQREVLDYLFHRQTITSLPVGWRFDGLGSPQFLEKQWQLSGGKDDPAKRAWWDGADGRPGFRDRWRKALVVAEYIGSGSDPKVALQQVRDFHVGLIGNGNFTSGRGTDSAHWDRVPEEQRSDWAAVGAAAGWRLHAEGDGTLTWNGTRFTWTGSVSNPGSSPAWEPWGARFTFGSTTVDLAIERAFPTPGETVTLSLTGSLPAGVSAATAWSWVPTLRGSATAWSGATPRGSL